MDWSKFFDIRKHKPQKGQVLAKFSAYGHFIDGHEKRNIISLLLTNPIGARTSQSIMRNACCVVEEEEVAKKEYEIKIQQNFWTERENILNDSHWSTINILNDLDSKMKFTYTFPS